MNKRNNCDIVSVKEMSDLIICIRKALRSVSSVFCGNQTFCKGYVFTSVGRVALYISTDLTDYGVV